jgi:RNA polymerase sigma factor (sigma-70 family)
MERENLNALIERWDDQYRAGIVRRLERRGVPEHCAEEAFQMALIKAFDRVGSDRGPQTGSERSWLFTLAWTAFLDDRRKFRRQPTLLDDLDQSSLDRIVSKGDPFDDASRNEEKEAVAAAIASATLTPLQEQVLVRHIFKGQSVSEIAKKLGRSRSAVAGVLDRALNRLLKALSWLETEAVT